MKVELTEEEISWLILGQQQLVVSVSAAEKHKALQAKLLEAREAARFGWLVTITDKHNG